MGAGNSSLTGSELELATSFVGEKPWPVDDERWESFIRLKAHPWMTESSVLFSDFSELASILQTNDEKSHNLSTLAVYVASRLPLVQNYYRTEIEQTIAGVVSTRGSVCFVYPPPHPLSFSIPSNPPPLFFNLHPLYPCPIL